MIPKAADATRAQRGSKAVPTNLDRIVSAKERWGVPEDKLRGRQLLLFPAPLGMSERAFAVNTVYRGSC